MDHRVYCVDARIGSKQLVYDTQWQTKAEIVRIISDLSRTVDILAPEIPIWIFWLYKYPNGEEPAFDSLEGVRSNFFKAITDHLIRHGKYPPKGLHYLPKKQPKSTSRCYSFLIGQIQ